MRGNRPFTIRFHEDELRDLQQLAAKSQVPMTAIMRIALNRVGAIRLRHEDLLHYHKVDFKLHAPGLSEIDEVYNEKGVTLGDDNPIPDFESEDFD